MSILIALAATLRYDEDIMDFLPITAEERQAIDSLQAQQSAARIVLIIEGEEEYEREDALYTIEDRLSTIHYPLSTFTLSDLSPFTFHLSTFPILSLRAKPSMRRFCAIKPSSPHPAVQP